MVLLFCLLSWIITMAYLGEGRANQYVSQVAFRIFPKSFVVLGICLEQGASSARLWVQALYMPLT